MADSKVSGLGAATELDSDDLLYAVEDGVSVKASIDTLARSPRLMIYSPDPLRKAVEAGSGGRVTVLYTANGEPSYMHVLPAFNIEDVVGDATLGTGRHPAFVVGGVEKSEIFIGVYQASVLAGEALSQPGKTPVTNINWDNAKGRCTACGPGWHLMTNWEWAAVALWCMANGYEPTGNTDWGRHHDERYQTARRSDGRAPGDTGGTGLTLTGSGPAAWAHDGTPAGIMDLVGNAWEWQDGLRLQDGRIHMPADNDYTMDDGDWPAQDLWITGSNTTGNNTASFTDDPDAVQRNGSIGDNANGSQSTRNPWSATVMNGTAPLVTKQALIVPAGIAPAGQLYARNYGARFPLRGGARNSAGLAGLGALALNGPRTYTLVNFGFRPAFII